MSDQTSEPAATGVQNLIDRIRDDGVKAGKEEAARALLEAKREAAKTKRWHWPNRYARFAKTFVTVTSVSTWPKDLAARFAMTPSVTHLYCAWWNNPAI